MTNLPAEIVTVLPVAGVQWEEVPPRTLMCGQLFKEIPTSSGGVWKLERSMTGLDLILTTDIPYASEEEAQGRPHRVYVLRGAPMIQQLFDRLTKGDQLCG